MPRPRPSPCCWPPRSAWASRRAAGTPPGRAGRVRWPAGPPRLAPGSGGSGAATSRSAPPPSTAPGPARPLPGTTGDLAPAGTPEASPRVRAAGLLLRARSRAVQGRDKAAWMATVDDPASPFGRRQSLMFDNLMRLPDEGFRYDAPAPGPALSAARARALRPPGVGRADPGPLRADRFRPRPAHVRGGVHLRPAARGVADRRRLRRGHHPAGVGPARAEGRPWPHQPRARQRLPGPHAPATATRPTPAFARVTAVWGPGWSSHVVLLTPATAAQFAALLGRTR